MKEILLEIVAIVQMTTMTLSKKLDKVIKALQNNV